MKIKNREVKQPVWNYTADKWRVWCYVLQTPKLGPITI